MHPRNISLGMQRPIFMKTFTNKDKYPFAFYCNATGDLFIPDTDPNGTPRDLKDMSELPYPLQALYERFWSEQYGWVDLYGQGRYRLRDDDGTGIFCGCW